MRELVHGPRPIRRIACALALIALFVSVVPASGDDTRQSGDQAPATTPSSSPAVDSSVSEDLAELLKQGLHEASYYNFTQAYRTFAKAAADAPAGSSAWQQAIYGQAVSAHYRTPSSRGNVDEATALYERLIDVTPTSGFAPRAMLNLGRLAELPDYFRDRPDLPSARKWYQRVLDEHGKELIAHEAVLRLAASYLQTFDVNDGWRGISLLEQWLAAHADNPLASTMWVTVADGYRQVLGENMPAAAAYDRAVEAGLTDQILRGKMYWRAARTAHRAAGEARRAGQDADGERLLAQAIRMYELVITDGVSSGQAYRAQLELRALGVDPPPIELLRSTLRDERPGASDVVEGGDHAAEDTGTQRGGER